MGWITAGNDILHTVDGGITWIDQNIPAHYNIIDFHFFDANNGWAVSNYRIFHTTSGGVSNIESHNTNNKITTYPNPSRNFLNIRIDDANLKCIDVEIINLLGNVILFERHESNSFQINISDIVSGTYLLKLKNNKGNLLKVEKIVK